MWISVNSVWLRLQNKCMTFFDLTIIEHMYLVLFVKSLICKRRKSSGYNNE